MNQKPRVAGEVQRLGANSVPYNSTAQVHSHPRPEVPSRYHTSCSYLTGTLRAVAHMGWVQGMISLKL